MRRSKYFIGEDGIPMIEPESSFLSCEKDTELIIEKLFIENRKFGNKIKKLLIIDEKDCIDENENTEKYDEIINRVNISKMVADGYIRLNPKLKLKENEPVKSYILITYDNFTPTSNDHFRDCTIMFDVICHSDSWDLDNYRQRPLKIVGCIDAVLNHARLTGIGKLEFISCRLVSSDEDLSGYCLMYRAVHGDDDTIEGEE